MNMGLNKLNFGCGKDYKEGWTNLDISSNVLADIYYDMNKLPSPFAKNCFDYVLMDNVLEHFSEPVKILEEVYRITKKGGVIEIIVPLAPTMFAFRDPTHKSFFTYRSMDYFEEGNGLNYYTNIRFKILERKIIFHHKLRFLNKIINSNEFFRKFITEFFSQLLPPTLISFKLEVIK